jgi:hypothetical protein
MAALSRDMRDPPICALMANALDSTAGVQIQAFFALAVQESSRVLRPGRQTMTAWWWQVLSSGFPKMLGRCSAARGRSRRMASAVERGHVRVAVAGWRADRGEAGEVIRAQHEVGGGSVLLQPGDPPGAGDRHDVVALDEQPPERHLRWSRANLGRYCLDLRDDAQVLLQVLLRETGIASSEVAGIELVRRADLAGQEPAAQW